jgi:hypothetical protein
VSNKQGAGSGIVKFAAVITLDRFDAAPKLSVDIRKEIRKRGESVRFKTEWKGPQKVRKIIKDN